MGWPTTHAKWRDLVRSWLDIDDSVAVTDDAINTFLDMATDSLNADVDSLATESGPFDYVCTGNEAWPVEFLQLGIDDYNRMILVNAVGGPAMEAKAINEMIDLIATNASPSGKPTAYAVHANQLYIWPRPSTDTVLQIRYSMKVKYLDSTFNENIYTASHPSAFLYAALIAAEPYIAEDERLGTWKALYAGQIETINLTAKQARMGSTPLLRDFNVYGHPSRTNVTRSGILIGG